MHKKLYSLSIIFAFLILGLLLFINSQASIETSSKKIVNSSSSLSNTIDSYIEAYNKGDNEKIISFFCEDTLKASNIDIEGVKNSSDTTNTFLGKIANYEILKTKSLANNLVIATIKYYMNNTEYTEDWVFKNDSNTWKLNNGVISLLRPNYQNSFYEIDFTIHSIIHSIEGSTTVNLSFINRGCNTLKLGLDSTAYAIATTTDGLQYYFPLNGYSKYNRNQQYTYPCTFLGLTDDIQKIEICEFYLLDTLGNCILDIPSRITIYELQ